jgi:hypothetical protein
LGWNRVQRNGMAGLRAVQAGGACSNPLPARETPPESIVEPVGDEARRMDERGGVGGCEAGEHAADEAIGVVVARAAGDEFDGKPGGLRFGEPAERFVFDPRGEVADLRVAPGPRAGRLRLTSGGCSCNPGSVT